MPYDSLMSLKIPNEHSVVLKSILGDRDRLAAVALVLDQMSPTLQLAHFSSELQRIWPNDSINATDAAGAFVSMCLTQALAKHPQEFIRDVIAAVSVDESPALIEDLGRILEHPNLVVLSRGSELWTDHPRTLVRAQIISDIRPIFSTSADEMVSCLIIHQLKLTCMEDDRMVELFVALDHKDLIEIRDRVQRALQKEETIRRSTALPSVLPQASQ